MALPTSKQPHEEPPPTWNSPFTPEWDGWDPNRVDTFGEDIHARHLSNFHKLLEVIERNRPVRAHENKLRYTRGHPRQNGQKLWLPYSESRNHTRWHALPEALPDDHVIVTHPVSELWAEAHNASLQIFPQYAESQPRHGLKLTREQGQGNPLNGYYLSNYGVIQVAYGRINRLMPYDAINLQVHEFESKLVWKAGASQRLDLAQYVFEQERQFTAQDWEAAAHNPEQFINSLRDGYMRHSGGHWTTEHDLMLTGLLQDTISPRIKWAIEAIQQGREPANKNLTVALKHLYTFNTVADTPRWGSYDEFLKSPEWQAKRAEVTNRSGGWCEMCKPFGVNRPAEHVHHVHYAKAWGQESAADLLHLCAMHHKIAHGNV